ncbi:MAG: tRNA (adenosine(37)-N6)-dimethylallyltransferase [Candidatus Dormibacteria bacterium]
MTGTPPPPPRRALAIAGPTAAGKTALAVEVALRSGAELLNADSRQVMRRLRVGTAAPTEAELRGVRCHLLDLTEPGETLPPPRWRELALGVLDDLAAAGVPAIVVGGPGQYQRALRQGWTYAAAAPDPALRAELTAVAATPAGMAALVGEVRARDPEGAAGLDLANPRRVIRALETLRGGAPSLAAGRRRGAAVELDLVVLDAEPEVHRRAAAARVADMFLARRLLDEVAAELARGTPAAALGNAGIGYPEALTVLAGESTPEAAGETTLRRTLHYAKSQRTWFRAEPARCRLTRGDGDSPRSLAEILLAP